MADLKIVRSEEAPGEGAEERSGEDAPNVLIWNGITKLDLPASRVLRMAEGEDLKVVVVAGEYGDGREFFAASVGGGPEALWLLQRAVLKLLRKGDMMSDPDCPVG